MDGSLQSKAFLAYYILLLNLLAKNLKILTELTVFKTPGSYRFLVFSLLKKKNVMKINYMSCSKALRSIL